MKSVPDFSLQQSRDQIEHMKCIHSRAAEYFTGNHDDHWIIPEPSDQDVTSNIDINRDIQVQRLIDQPGCSFLGAYQSNIGKISVLYTVTSKQKIPFCSICTSHRCKCFHQYKKIFNDLEIESNQDGPQFHWERRQTEPEHRSDYLEALEMSDHYRTYGYNMTPFEYPIWRDSNLQAKYIQRIESNGQFNLPTALIAEFRPDMVCNKHQNHFDPSNERLVQTSRNMVIYTQTKDLVVETATFARPTTPFGCCKCLHHYDGHENLLWNLGLGKMVDYTYLHYAIHQVTDGFPLNGVYKSRSTTYFNSLGPDVKSSLSYSDFERACSGYARMMRFRKEDFLCLNCGHTPKYIVADGKMSGPTKRKVLFSLYTLEYSYCIVFIH